MKDSEFIELVEKAIDKLELQGKPSKIGTGGCFYQGEDGACCIVGHMMPDNVTREKADISFEPAIVDLYRSGFPWALQFTNKQIKVLSGLQSLHDNVKLDRENEFSNSIAKMREVIGNY
jgi:hypothetical protein